MEQLLKKVMIAFIWFVLLLLFILGLAIESSKTDYSIILVLAYASGATFSIVLFLKTWEYIFESKDKDQPRP